MTAPLFRSTISFAIAAAATILTVAGSAAPVNAAAVNAAPTAIISTSGIDLTGPAGVARIEAQVRRAARQVCSTADRGVRAQQLARACTQTAIAAAMPQLAQLAANARDARTALADAPQPTAPVRR